MGLSVNVAIGLQVLLGALTTGIAAAVQSGRQVRSSCQFCVGKVVPYMRYAHVGTGIDFDIGLVPCSAAFSMQANTFSSIVGGMSTLVASYLARTRGTGEPELSEKRTNDLEQFLRECTAFDMDHGHEYATRDLDQQIDSLRRRFEDLLGNINV